MANDDDYDYGVIRRAPKKGDAIWKRLKLSLRFIFVGIGLALIILIFGNQITSSDTQLTSISGMILGQAISAGILCLLLGIVQSQVFGSKLKGRAWLFILVSLIGGLIGGIIGGWMMNAGIIKESIPMGGIIGAIAGAVSSLLQNQLMSGKKSKPAVWFLYSVFSWMIICSLGWLISWSINSINRGPIGLAVAAVFIMTSGGIALFIFLKLSPLEFN